MVAPLFGPVGILCAFCADDGPDDDRRPFNLRPQPAALTLWSAIRCARLLVSDDLSPSKPRSGRVWPAAA